jgi:hypothetical protein
MVARIQCWDLRTLIALYDKITKFGYVTQATRVHTVYVANISYGQIA